YEVGGSAVSARHFGSGGAWSVGQLRLLRRQGFRNQRRTARGSAMARNTPRLCFIGFGEAGQAFASGLRTAGVTTMAAGAVLFPQDAGAKLRTAGKELGVRLGTSAADAIIGADIVLAAVTAASSLAAAEQAKPHLKAGQLYLDINSVSPGRKQATARHLDGS